MSTSAQSTTSVPSSPFALARELVYAQEEDKKAGPSVAGRREREVAWRDESEISGEEEEREITFNDRDFVSREEQIRRLQNEERDAAQRRSALIAINEQEMIRRTAARRSAVPPSASSSSLLPPPHRPGSSSTPSHTAVPQTPATDFLPLAFTFTPAAPHVQNASTQEWLAIDQVSARRAERDALPLIQDVSQSAGPHYKVPFPHKFSGTDTKENSQVEVWLTEVLTYLDHSGVVDDAGLVKGIGYFLSSEALKFYSTLIRDLALVPPFKRCTYDYLHRRLVERFGSDNSVTTRRLTWRLLRMGVKSGTETDTYTVATYTALFKKLAAELEPGFSPIVSAPTLVEKYEKGIEDGYPALWNQMQGDGRVTVALVWTIEQVEARAIQAESTLRQRSMEKRAHPSSFSNPSSNSSFGRARINQTSMYDDETPEEGKPAQLTAVTTRHDGAEPGRFMLTDSQKQMLRDEKRCFRCHGRHPFGKGQPRCTRPAATSAPTSLPLNS